MNRRGLAGGGKTSVKNAAQGGCSKRCQVGVTRQGEAEAGWAFGWEGTNGQKVGPPATPGTCRGRGGRACHARIG